LWEQHIRIPDDVIDRLESKPEGTQERVMLKLTVNKNTLEIVDMKGCFICEIYFDIYVTVEIKNYLPTQTLKYSESENILSEILRFNTEVDGKNIDIDVIRNAKGVVVES